MVQARHGAGEVWCRRGMVQARYGAGEAWCRRGMVQSETMCSYACQSIKHLADVATFFSGN